MVRIVQFIGTLLIASSLSAPVLGQTNPPSNNASFTYSGTTGSGGGNAATRFEMQFDAGSFVPMVPPLPTPVNGVFSFDFPSTLTVSTHTVAVRACNSAGCGPASVSVGFTFVPFAAIPTATPVVTVNPPH